jgi:5'-methylthioadenosine phosphorylase
VLEVAHANADKAKRMILALAAILPADMPSCPAGSDRALEYALMTAPEKRDPALLAKLDAVAGRVLKRGASFS